jgi:hypothetical protein
LAIVSSQKVLYEDVRNLKNLGLNGFISCQVQRAFFPTGLGMYVMGKTLWNDRLDYDDIVDGYFNAAFGGDGQLCRDYMEKLSGLSDMDYMNGSKPFISSCTAEAFGRIPEIIDAFLPVILRNIGNGNKCYSRSWEYLKHHADLCKLLAGAVRANASGETDTVDVLWNQAVNYVQVHESKLQPVFDTYSFINTVGTRMKHLKEHRRYRLNIRKVYAPPASVEPRSSGDIIYKVYN